MRRCNLSERLSRTAELWRVVAEDEPEPLCVLTLARC